jgi:uncharacterized membrane protein
MAHERIEIDLALAKVYDLISNPVDFPKFMTEVDEVNKISSQSFEFVTNIEGEEFRWTANVIDDLRNTRFAWITINGNLNQTATVRVTPLDNGTRTRVDFSIDYRPFFGEPSEDLSQFIESIPALLKGNLDTFKELAENDGFAKEKETEKAKEEEAAV